MHPAVRVSCKSLPAGRQADSAKITGTKIAALLFASPFCLGNKIPMATRPQKQAQYSPTVREQKFAYLYAQGLCAADAARQAGYSQSTIKGKAYKLPRSPKIMALIQQYRHSFGILDAAVLRQCLESVFQIAHDPAQTASARLTAIRGLIKLYQQNREQQFLLRDKFQYPPLLRPYKTADDQPTETDLSFSISD
jgi:hypothetical protein